MSEEFLDSDITSNISYNSVDLKSSEKSFESPHDQEINNKIKMLEDLE